MEAVVMETLVDGSLNATKQTIHFHDVKAQTIEDIVFIEIDDNLHERQSVILANQ